VGFKGKNTSALLDTTEENSSRNILKLFCGVSYTGGKPLPLYPTPEKIYLLYLTTEENLFRFKPYWKKTLNLNNCTKINFSQNTFYA
jgi:hypothetical protein